jgi:HlyD family secretion protein
VNKIIHKLKKANRLVLFGFLIIILGLTYYAIQKSSIAAAEVQYTTTAVKKGSLITSVSGSGQVATTNIVELKPNVAGTILYIGATKGQEIKAGTVIASIDSADAQKSLRDAETNLESAQLSLQKLQQPADSLSLLQAKNSLTASKENKNQSIEDLANSYEDSFNSVANAFLDLPELMADFKGLLFGDDLADYQWNLDWYSSSVSVWDSTVRKFKNEAHASYLTAQENHIAGLELYKKASRFSDQETIETLLNKTLETTKLIAEAVKDTNNLVDFAEDLMIEHSVATPNIVRVHQTNLDDFTATTNNHVEKLSSLIRAIEASKQKIVEADRSIREKESSLEKLQAGTDPLDVASQQLTIKQRGNAVIDAQKKLTDYSVRAPFDAIVAKLDAKKGEQTESSNVIATLISKNKLAEIVLNEVDVTSVKIGQKVTLTFDAINDFTITGELVEIDSLGVVSQGVVTYGVKISFDTEDSRIKSGMTVNAAIIVERKDNVVLAPNAAVQIRNGQSFVQTLNDGQITTNQIVVEIGSSNELFTEIVSGLEPGTEVVTGSFGGANTPSPTGGQSILPGFGGRGGGGFGR